MERASPSLSLIEMKVVSGQLHQKDLLWNANAFSSGWHPLTALMPSMASASFQLPR